MHLDVLSKMKETIAFSLPCHLPLDRFRQQVVMKSVCVLMSLPAFSPTRLSWTSWSVSHDVHVYVRPSVRTSLI